MSNNGLFTVTNKDDPENSEESSLTICNKRIEVEGIILILSCEKHRYTRLKKCGPEKKNYNGWKVITVIGNLFLDKEYKVEDDFLFIRCEDSYIHLLKKLALSLKYLNKLFLIKQGILRCGDDLIFNEKLLEEFLKSKKYDFCGKAYCGKNYTSSDINLLKKTRYDPFMLKYYINHQNELTDIKHNINLTIHELRRFLIRPNVWGPAGIIYYLSMKSSNIIINTMEEVNYNIFHLDEFTNSYPYILEDVGITYIMYYNKVPFINNKTFFDNGKQSIALHTNMNK